MKTYGVVVSLSGHHSGTRHGLNVSWAMEKCHSAIYPSLTTCETGRKVPMERFCDNAKINTTIRCDETPQMIRIQLFPLSNSEDKVRVVEVAVYSPTHGDPWQSEIVCRAAFKTKLFMGKEDPEQEMCERIF